MVLPVGELATAHPVTKVPFTTRDYLESPTVVE
jgi:hypothetical protein